MNIQDFIKLCDFLPLDKDDEHGIARTKLDIMTLKEYGPLNDKVLFVRALESLVGKEIHSSLTTPSALYSQRDIDLINECFGKINDALAQITAFMRLINDSHPFFFCRFLSMEQVYFLINESKNNDSFAEKIRGSYVNAGTQDFWNEYLLANQQYK